MPKYLHCLICAIFLLASVFAARADTAAFDLVGPTIDVRVTRAGKSLPVAQVPNLQAGDRLWIHPDLPATQSARYLLIVAFLRGTTNPPPESWFTKVETWTRPVQREGVLVTVPDEAQQALLFVAPETGGDFPTLRAAVRGKPGAFVRAAQDLVQASLDRTRLERYLSAIRETSASDPKDLQERTTLLARSLNIKLDQQCFDKPMAQQLPCLTQNTDQLVLDDAHSQSIVASLASGTSADLLTQITNTPRAGGGYYSPYVGAIVDMVRILGSAHTAKYQYIPALALPAGDSLHLRLNNPPSFRNPKSVMVVGLPPIGPSPQPPLRPTDSKQVFCAGNPSLLLPLEGAPLVFATDLAHDFTLEMPAQSGATVALPARSDASKGGFVVDTHTLQTAGLEQSVTGKLGGFWGFERLDGPTFRLRSPGPAKWTVASSNASALIVGRDDTLHLKSDQAVCVQDVTLEDHQGKKVATEWKATKPDSLEVKVALQSASPGAVTMKLQKFGSARPDELPLRTYAEAGHLSGFSIHAGDASGVLKGTRLDQVAGLELHGVRFSPGTLIRANQQDQLAMQAEAGSSGTFEAGAEISGNVTLKDGRVLPVQVTVEPARPRVTLIGKNVQMPGAQTQSTIHLGNSDELAQDSQLSFALQTQVPQRFNPTEKIEVATDDESFRVALSVADGNLTYQDPHTVMAVLDPMKHLGPSAFGQLKFRPVDDKGAAGDWQPLATLVRTPSFTEVRCAGAGEKQCFLSGEKLFLIEAVSTDPQFANAITVPEGFIETTLSIPAPANKTIYFKLRDDPSVVNSATVSVIGPARPPSGG